MEEPVSFYSYYDLLGVSPTATLEVIKAAYRARISACHPDHNRSPDAHEMATLINEAWHVLGDPERRRLYDATLASPENAGARQSSDSVSDSVPSERVPWACPRCDRHVPCYVDLCRCGQERPYSTDRSTSAHPTRHDPGHMRYVYGLMMIAVLSVPLGLGLGLLMQLGERMAAAGVGWFVAVAFPSALALFLLLYFSLRGSVAVADGGTGFYWVVALVNILVTVFVGATYTEAVGVQLGPWYQFLLLWVGMVKAYTAARQDVRDGTLFGD